MSTDEPPERARLARLRHDLRTPLNQIIGYAEMLAEDAPEALLADLQRIRAAAIHQMTAIEEAVGLLSAEAGAAPASRAPTPTPATHLDDVDDVADGAGRRVLVVDDEAGNRDMLARRLRRRGYVVDEAADGPTALARVDAAPPDLVLLDIMMPGMSGLEVLRELRDRRALEELPVIMASARDASDDVVEALRLGANDYVVKPINLPVVLARIRTQLALRRAHVFIRSVFGRYLSDAVVDSLLDQPGGLALGGELRTVTVMMADLRGFSPLAETLPPERVLRLLNTFLGAMTDVIHRHGGTIDEFLGDALLVLFGAPTLGPDDARRAVACALDMQRAMVDVNARNAALGLPAIEMGIGLNTGDVVVGNIGSERRAKYGVVGRHVNLAARIQAYTVGGQILASEATLVAAGDDVHVGGWLEVSPKGATGPMRLCELAGLGDDAAHPPRRVDPPRPLAAPLAVRVALVDDSRIREGELATVVTHLSAHRAVLACGAMPALATVRLGFADGHAYARVLAADADGVHVHFTWIAAEVRAVLDALLIDAP